MKHLRITTVRL